MLVLASASASRKAMLKAAGVNFEAIPAMIDERALEHSLGGVAPAEVAQALAIAKALAMSQSKPGRLVLGSDSLVELGGTRFDKPRDKAEAAAHLRAFSGRTMQLHSAAALVRDGSVLWSHSEPAELAVRALSARFIDRYLTAEWPAVAGCVGVFRIEGLGVQLFEEISGSHFTVLGMPLLAVLRALRAHGGLAG